MVPEYSINQKAEDDLQNTSLDPAGEFTEMNDNMKLSEPGIALTMLPLLKPIKQNQPTDYCKSKEI